MVPRPYRSDEIAAAVLDAARREQLAFRRVTVIPDDRARVWIVRVEGADGREERLTFPYASARAIYTPAEIATHLVRRSWPFG